MRSRVVCACALLVFGFAASPVMAETADTAVTSHGEPPIVDSGALIDPEPPVVQYQLDGPRIGETPAHGTGCTLSAAITAGLAAGLSVADAVARARRYVRRALESAPALGRGRRPLNHLVTPDGR